MIYSSERNRPSAERSPRRIPGNAVFVLLAVIVTISGGSLFLFGDRSLPTIGNEEDFDAEFIEDLWNAQQFERILEITEPHLDREPFDAAALVFDGLASYFLSVEVQTAGEASALIDRSVTRLRRALALPDTPHRREAEYTLGLAYFERGDYYHDLVVDHLERSIALGKDTPLVHEYLGIAYRNLGELEQSIQHFRAAVEKEPRDITYLTLAETYRERQQSEEAEEYLNRVISGSDEPRLVHEARLLLGRIYLEHEQYEDAYRQFNEVLDEDPNSADAQFYLGEYYYHTDDSVRARSYWRSAVNLDSGHRKAIERLES